MVLLKRKFVTFLVKQKIIEENTKHFMDKVMSKVIILRCEFDYISQAFRYEAYCEEFRELDLGESLPRYVLRQRTNDNGIEFEFCEEVGFCNIEERIYSQDDSIDILNLSVRTYNALKRNDIFTIRDWLIKKNRTMIALGDKGKEEIEAKLIKFGFV